MNTLFLYSLCVLIWGSTWFAITYQIKNVAPEVSVFYRFFLAALISFVISLVTRQRLKFKSVDHLWLFIQGLCMFCLNYILTYYSEGYVSSGLIAVTFTLGIYFNMLGMRIFYGQRIRMEVLAAAAVGGLGIICLFYRELAAFQMKSVTGLSLGILATFISSMGSVSAVRSRRKNLGVLPSNAWGMLYGALVTGLIALLTHKHFSVPQEASYFISLFYLAIFGTVIAFFAYVTLIGRIGPDRAGYTGILTPVLALILSTLFEHFHWSFLTFLGVALSLAGNYLVLRKKV